MSYYFAKVLKMSFDDALDRAVEQLGVEGFGVLTKIDVQETLNNKLGIKFPRYTILGACNPSLAYEALKVEDRIGTMLPCNVIVRDNGGDGTEVAAVDPLSSMQAIENPNLKELAGTVQQKLRRVIEAL